MDSEDQTKQKELKQILLILKVLMEYNYDI